MTQNQTLLDFFIQSILHESLEVNDINTFVDLNAELAKALHSLNNKDKADEILNNALSIVMRSPDPNALRDLAHTFSELGLAPILKYAETFNEKKVKWIADGGQLGNRRFKTNTPELPHLHATTQEYFVALEQKDLELLLRILKRDETLLLGTFSPYDISLSELVGDDLNAVVTLSESLKPWKEDCYAFLDDMVLKYFATHNYQSAFFALRLISDTQAKKWSYCRSLICKLKEILSNQLEVK